LHACIGEAVELALKSRGVPALHANGCPVSGLPAF
jgi:hypothetical protein